MHVTNKALNLDWLHLSGLTGLLKEPDILKELRGKQRKVKTEQLLLEFL